MSDDLVEQWDLLKDNIPQDHAEAAEKLWDMGDTLADRIKALEAERDRYKTRAGAAERAAKDVLKRWENEIHNEYDGTSMLQGRLSECDDIRATLAQIDAEPADEINEGDAMTIAYLKGVAEGRNQKKADLADAYRAGRDAAAQSAYEGLYPKNDQSDWTEFAKIHAAAAMEVSATIRALPVPPEFGGE